MDDWKIDEKQSFNTRLAVIRVLVTGGHLKRVYMDSHYDCMMTRLLDAIRSAPSSGIVCQRIPYLYGGKQEESGRR